ncbi:DUF4406 domain-containing protein [Eubacterium limosum]|uniref:DUF4406 domain-containing protein n=1 Tax=Eubacterium limosum TaxID=1736 RepID=A0ABT5UYM1_EUBLI|nr:DUF4406 domain-containing protein [Eubacterium limosum]MCB6572193.1 DUF4406 domain-containing protein [Eubacterium limosum]MDE1472926.1 DUF4406 domain-containing protein [Eubacterium limosum]
MIKLDPTKMYYLSHPCTSVGTMAENKWHEQECVDAILLSQEGYVCRDHPGDNKIKLVRPLTLIPECMPENHAMERCMSLLEACDAIILCDDWQFSKGCLEEKETAESWGMEVLCYSEVIK